MGSYNFMEDTEKLGNLKKFIDQKTVMIEENITELYKMLENVSASGVWTGSAYENFCKNCNNYKNSLNTMTHFLSAYGELVDKVSTDAEKLNSDISEICKIGG